MITPRFKLSQDDNIVFVTIHAPFSKISVAEINMDRHSLLFYSKPYYLRLNLPGEIIENEDAKADFDADTNEVTISCPKVVKGEYFKDLDMLTSLLEPKGKRNIDGNKIEVLGEDSSTLETESESDFDWFVEQQIPEEVEPSVSLASYGFASKHSGLFSTLAEELQEILDVKDPDHQSLADKRIDRIAQEKTKFNPGHYLADLFQADEIIPLIEFKIAASDDDWTEAEQDLLKNFPRKDHLIDPDTLQSVYLGLVDIILAYCYDMRSNMDGAESAWTIAKLSGTLSWLEEFTSLQDVAVCFLRRSLCYPMYRNFKLSLKVLEDTVNVFKQGKKRLLKCLLDVFQLFAKSDPRYLLNQLYIQDYCIWIQNCNEETLKSLASSLELMKLSKEDVDLNLADLERAATNLLCADGLDSDSDSSEDLETNFSKLSLKNPGIPMDMLIAAQAAGISASSSSDLDSDDLSEEESSDDSPSEE